MALKADPADQALLLDLQKLDTRLQQLGHRASKLPESARVTELAAEFDRFTRTVAEQTGSWEDARTELRRVESDVAVVDARIERDRSRLEGSSSVKDIQGLETELAALAKRKEELEDIELCVMETVEERETSLAHTRDALAALVDAQSEAVAARDAALGSIDTERAATTADRDHIAGRVPADLLALYEKQRGRYGVGASLLQGGVSLASGVALGASDMSMVRSAAPDDVILCPDSNAILVRTGESGL